jgi:hypothetical protein
VPLPKSLAGVSVTMNSVTAPLYFVSPTQINAQVPYEILPGTAVVTVRADRPVYKWCTWRRLDPVHHRPGSCESGGAHRCRAEFHIND